MRDSNACRDLEKLGYQIYRGKLNFRHNKTITAERRMRHTEQPHYNRGNRQQTPQQCQKYYNHQQSHHQNDQLYQQDTLNTNN